MAQGLLTRRHTDHYLGNARHNIRRTYTDPAPTLKAILHTYRLILTGTHLNQRGSLEVHLPTLASDRNLLHINDLVDRRVQGEETLSPSETYIHLGLPETMLTELEHSRETTKLPNLPTVYDELNELLIDLRLKGVH